jgi:hypothetical protein
LERGGEGERGRGGEGQEGGGGGKRGWEGNDHEELESHAPGEDAKVMPIKGFRV